MNLLKTLAWKPKLLLLIANKHAQTSDNTVSYKHVNFCGKLRPCEKNQIEEEYCIHHRNEKTRTWYKALSDLAKKSLCP